MTQPKQADAAELTLLGRDAILAAKDGAYENVDIPEWGGTVRVKAMTGEQRDAFEQSIVRERKDGSQVIDGHDMRAKFVARVCVDDKDVRLFTNEDVQALSRKSAAALQRVFDVGARLAGMDRKQLKSLEGNSDGQSDGSTTA